MKNLNRILSLLLILALSLSLFGCNTKEDDIITPTSSLSERDQLADIPETVIYDDNDIKIIAANILQTLNGGEIIIDMTNNTDTKITFAADAIVVNGITLGAGYSITADANERTRSSIKLNYTVLDVAHITNLATIESPDARIFVTDGYQKLYDVPFHLETAIADTHTTPLDEGPITYEENGLRVTAVNIRHWRNYTTATLLITNNTGKNIVVKGEKFTMESVSAVSWLYGTIYNGTSRYCEFTVDSVVNNMAALVSAYDAEDYSLICTTELNPVSFSNFE